MLFGNYGEVMQIGGKNIKVGDYDRASLDVAEDWVNFLRFLWNLKLQEIVDYLDYNGFEKIAKFH